MTSEICGTIKLCMKHSYITFSSNVSEFSKIQTAIIFLILSVSSKLQKQIKDFSQRVSSQEV